MDSINQFFQIVYIKLNYPAKFCKVAHQSSQVQLPVNPCFIELITLFILLLRLFARPLSVFI